MKVKKNKMVETIIKLAVFSSPLLWLRWPDFNLTLSNFLFALLFFVLIIANKGDFRFRNLSFTNEKTYFIGVIVLLIGVCFSSLANNVTMNVLIILVQYFFCLVIIPLTFQSTFYSQAYKLLTVYLLGISIVLIIAVILYYFFPTAPITDQLSQGNGRMYSLLENPNTFGKIISTVIPWVLALIVINSKFKNRVFYLLILILCVLGLMTASSFGAIISSLLGISSFFILVIIFSKNIVNTTKILISILIPLIIVFYITSLTIPEIFYTRILETDSSMGSLEIKKELMIEAIDIISMNFFSGIGFGNHPSVSNFNVNVHNTYLLIFSEGGLIAFLGFILILFGILMKFIRVIASVKYSKDKILMAGIISSYVAFLVNLFTNTHIYGSVWWILIFIGILVSQEILIRNKKMSKNDLKAQSSNVGLGEN